jgi:uncharacterized repeat protein (TIGR03803 family)
MKTEAMSAPATHFAICMHCKKAIIRRSGSSVLAFAMALVLLTSASSPAQTFTILYNFKGGTDGIGPMAGLVMDAAGNFYGTTEFGGINDNGTVFKLTRKEESILYRFTGSPDGANPSGGLIFDAEGNLYGVTSEGGKVNCGTVFKLAPSGTETVLHSFCSNGETDGARPSGNLIMDAKGNLYGTTLVGGSEGSGTVFKVDLSGAETVLYNFCTKGGSQCTDGEEPQGGLVMDAAGNLYGTTAINLGPKLTGTGGVFKLTPTGKDTTLHRFSFAKGVSPNGGLIFDTAGSLYGTTLLGGSNICQLPGQNNGCGTVFKVDATGKETVLYDFCSASGCADGSAPGAGLFMDAQGNLYGTTLSGGTGTCTGQLFPGCGTVFELSANGTENVLHTFTGIESDGAYPYSILIMDAKGNLYGTTSAGGKFGNGIVFEITP